MNERMTKRDTDGQAVMDCKKCKADWMGKYGKPMVECTALYCQNRLKDRLAAYEDTGLTPEQLPTSDVAPVVRCRDCKYWGDEAGVTVRTDGVRFARCKVHNLCVGGKKIGWCPTEDDFCGQGERRTGNGKAVDEG